MICDESHKKQTVPVQVRLTEKMILKAEQLLKDGLYVNISDVIRAGLRKKLKEGLDGKA